MTASDQGRLTGKALGRLSRNGGWALGMAIAAPLVAGLLLIWQASVLAQVLGRAIEGHAAPQALLPALGTFGAILLTRALLAAVAERAGAAGAEAVKLGLRQALFTALLRRKTLAGASHQSGMTAAAIIDQTEGLHGYFAGYLPAMVQATVLPLAFAALIVPIDWVAGILFLLTAPLIPLFMALVGWGAQHATQRQARALTLLSGRFVDRLRGALTLKLFGRAEWETSSIVTASELLRQRTLKVLQIAFLSSAVLEFFAALGVAGIALYAGLSLIGYFNFGHSPMTLSTGLFLLLMAPEVYNPLRQLAAHYHDRAAAKAAIGEIEAQFGALPARAEVLADHPPLPHRFAISVRLEEASLHTPDGAETLLDRVTLPIVAGQHVAIVGPSGIGKSSLLEAIARLRPSEGGILLDGIAVEDWEDAALRGRVAMLTQRPRLIAGTVADNLAMALPGATRAQMLQALEQAQLAAFVAALPKGIETVIGEDGVGLSGGQAQRLALARIYLRDAGLLLLDEPTAHLDPALESVVLDRLLRYAHGRTLIVSTHSAAVAQRMDQIWRIAGQTLLPVPLAAQRQRVA